MMHASPALPGCVAVHVSDCHGGAISQSQGSKPTLTIYLFILQFYRGGVPVSAERNKNVECEFVSVAVGAVALIEDMKKGKNRR